jgi:hypothetical protein
MGFEPTTFRISFQPLATAHQRSVILFGIILIMKIGTHRLVTNIVILLYKIIINIIAVSNAFFCFVAKSYFPLKLF